MRPPASLYVGWLRHRRFSPVAHDFRYPVFMVLLDIDRIPEAMQASRFTSYNRWNWASYHEADHFGDPGLSLRARLAIDAGRQGITLPAGRIELLTHLRYAGYCFNPVSFFYCHDEDGRLVHILAEVNNTFGGSHNYWLTPADLSAVAGPATGAFRAASNKALYVSPFLERDMVYGFAFNRPGAQLTAHIDVRRHRRGRKVLDATLMVSQRPWTAAEIGRTLRRYPWMTARVMTAIHWEALKLWWKGVAVVPRPRPAAT